MAKRLENSTNVPKAQTHLLDFCLPALTVISIASVSWCYWLSFCIFYSPSSASIGYAFACIQLLSHVCHLFFCTHKLDEFRYAKYLKQLFTEASFWDQVQSFCIVGLLLQSQWFLGSLCLAVVVLAWTWDGFYTVGRSCTPLFVYCLCKRV